MHRVNQKSSAMQTHHRVCIRIFNVYLCRENADHGHARVSKEQWTQGRGVMVGSKPDADALSGYRGIGVVSSAAPAVAQYIAAKICRSMFFIMLVARDI